MKVIQTTLAKISEDQFLRDDQKFYQFLERSGWDIFGNGKNGKNRIPLRDILIEDYKICDYQEFDEYKGVPTGQQYIDTDGDIVSYDIVTFDDHPQRLKYSISADNIVLSSLRLAKSPAFMFDAEDIDEYVFSNGFYIFRVVDDGKWRPKFICYILRHKALKNLLDENLYRGIGISAYKSSDLLSVQIKNLSINEQDQALEKIAPIEAEISTLKQSRKSHAEIIDEVFQREFGYDYEKFEELKSHRLYGAKQDIFSNNPDLRFSAKFHRPAGEFVMEQLTAASDKKIKHFLAEPIVLGASVSPADYDESGTYYYISMATIKSWAFDQEAAAVVSDSYASQKMAKTVRKDDIILARSGEGTIGKVALITDDVDGIFADFTMRIRLKDYSPRFAYYYFRTTFFQYLIEIYKKGLGNNTNIFPIVIQEFPVPDISLSEQERIVKEIQDEIDKQDEIKKQIASLRQQIDQIITEAIA